MFTRAPDGLEVLVQAFKESAGETVDIVVDQEVAGITVEMFRWWMPQIPNYYTMWYPEAHIAARVEVPPGGGAPIEIIREMIGEFDTVLYLAVSPQGKGTAILSPDGETMGRITIKVEPSPNGIQMRTTFQFPAKTPQPFLDAMREHCRGEWQDLPRFLPELYRQSTK